LKNYLRKWFFREPWFFYGITLKNPSCSCEVETEPRPKQQSDDVMDAGSRRKREPTRRLLAGGNELNAFGFLIKQRGVRGNHPPILVVNTS